MPQLRRARRLKPGEDRDPRLKRELRARVRRLYEDEGLTVQEIARRLRLSPGRVYLLALEAGADLRPRGRRPRRQRRTR